MILKKLTEAEEVVMKAVWDCKKEPVLSEVAARLKEYEKDWKPQTVSTFMAKLVQKQYVQMKRNGKIYTYKVLVKEEDYNKTQLKHLYTFLYRNNKEQMRQDLEEMQSA